MGNKFNRSSESKFTKSTGLYPTCEWDDKAVKKLINKKKIAPRYPGRENGGADTEECPICFLWYPGGLNRSKCCRQPICTECYLQFKKPSSQKAVQCPFCNAYNYSVKYYGSLSKEEREAIEQEEQKVIAAQIRMKKEELARQEEREKEVAEERKKRAEQGPPPTPPPARPSPNPVQPSAERPSNSESTRRMPAAQHPQPRSAARHHGHYAATSNPGPPQQELEDQDFIDREMDVEELMVMEAIRLSLLESRPRGQGGPRDDESAERGRGESADDSSDIAADLDDVEFSEDESWPDMQDQEGAAAAASHGRSPAASSRIRSGFQEALHRVEAATAQEDESGGVADLISLNQSWFSGLMMTNRSDDDGVRASASPHPTSSPAALEPASTLSPMLTAKPFTPRRSPVSLEASRETEKTSSPLQSMRDRGITPARYQKSPPQAGPARESPGGPAARGKTAADGGSAGAGGGGGGPSAAEALSKGGESRLEDIEWNPPISPILLSAGDAPAIESMEGATSNQADAVSASLVGLQESAAASTSDHGDGGMESESGSVLITPNSKPPFRGPSWQGGSVAVENGSKKWGGSAVEHRKSSAAGREDAEGEAAKVEAARVEAAADSSGSDLQPSHVAAPADYDQGPSADTTVGRRPSSHAASREGDATHDERSAARAAPTLLLRVLDVPDGRSSFLRCLGTDGAAPPDAESAEFLIGGKKLRIRDVGAGAANWPDDLAGVKAVVFLCSLPDAGGAGEVSAELHRLLQAEGLAQVPFLLLAAQPAPPDPAGVAAEDGGTGEDVYIIARRTLGLEKVLTGKRGDEEQLGGRRPAELFVCSTAGGGGSEWRRGVEWLGRCVDAP